MAADSERAVSKSRALTRPYGGPKGLHASGHSGRTPIATSKADKSENIVESSERGKQQRDKGQKPSLQPQQQAAQSQQQPQQQSQQTVAAARPRSSGQVRQQYLAHLGIDQSNSFSGSTSRPGSGGLVGRRAGAAHQTSGGGKSRSLSVDPQAGPHAASPPVMQSLNGGAPVWWRRAFSGNGQPAKGFAASPAANHRRNDGNNSPMIPPAKKGVHFNDMVEVRYVPLHSDYSQRVRQKYWNSAEELWQMAARNSLEFASEGYDYTQAIEEEVCCIHFPTDFPLALLTFSSILFWIPSGFNVFTELHSLGWAADSPSTCTGKPGIWVAKSPCMILAFITEVSARQRCVTTMWCNLLLIIEGFVMLSVPAWIICLRAFFG